MLDRLTEFVPYSNTSKLVVYTKEYKETFSKELGKLAS